MQLGEVIRNQETVNASRRPPGGRGGDSRPCTIITASPRVRVSRKLEPGLQPGLSETLASMWLFGTCTTPTSPFGIQSYFPKYGMEPQRGTLSFPIPSGLTQVSPLPTTQSSFYQCCTLHLPEVPHGVLLGPGVWVSPSCLPLRERACSKTWPQSTTATLGFTPCRAVFHRAGQRGPGREARLWTGHFSSGHQGSSLHSQASQSPLLALQMSQEQDSQLSLKIQGLIKCVCV